MPTFTQTVSSCYNLPFPCDAVPSGSRRVCAQYGLLRQMRENQKIINKFMEVRLDSSTQNPVRANYFVLIGEFIIGGLGKSPSNGRISTSSNNKSGTITDAAKYCEPPEIYGLVTAGAKKL